MNSVSHRVCELGQDVDAARGEHETLFSSELDEEMYGLQNVSKQIQHQLQLNVSLNFSNSTNLAHFYLLCV